MARIPNELSFNSGFNISASQPIDSRMRVEFESDLTKLSTWPQDKAKAYKGMLVAVIETGNLYILLEDAETDYNVITRKSSWGLVYGARTLDKKLPSYVIIDSAEASEVTAGGVVPTKYTERLGVVYLVSNGTGDNKNAYKEYVVAQKTVNSNIVYVWELLGEQTISLDGYTTEEKIAELLNAFSGEITTNYTNYANGISANTYNTINAVVTRLDNADATIANDLANANNRIASAESALTATNDAIIAIEEELNEEIVRKLSATTEQFSIAISGLTNDIATANEALNSIQGGLSGSTEDFNEKIATLNEKLASVSASTGSLSSYTNSLYGQLTTQGEYINTVSGSVNSVVQDFNAFSGVIITYAETTSEDAYNRAGQYIDAMSGSIITEARRLASGDSVGISETIAGQKVSAMEATVKTYAEQLNASGKTYAENLVDGANGRITDLVSKVDTVSSAVTSAFTQIDATNATITSQISRIDTVSGSVSNVGNKMDAMSASIITYAETVSNDAYTNATQYIDGLSGTIITEARRIMSGDSIGISETIAGQKISAMEASIKTYAESVSESAETRVTDELNALSGYIHTELVNYDKRLSAATAMGVDYDLVNQHIDTYLTTYEPTGMTGLRTTIDGINDTIGNYGTSIDQLNSAVTSAMTQIDLTNGKITNEISRIDTVSGRVDTVGTELNSLSGSVINYAKSIDAVSGRVIDVKSELNAFSGYIENSVVKALSGEVVTMGTSINTMNETITNDLVKQDDYTEEIKAVRQEFNLSAMSITQSITDITKSGGTLDSRISQSLTGITQTVGRIDELSGATMAEFSVLDQRMNEITLGVYSGETRAQIIAKINDAGDESDILIEANNILIKGDTAVDGNFFASIAEIGGINLANGAITNGYFEVDAEGNMSASSAYISGEIVADSGLIGNVGINVEESGTTYPLYTENFKVDETGKLSATDANISGGINASYGNIGDVQINTYVTNYVAGTSGKQSIGAPKFMVGDGTTTIYRNITSALASPDGISGLIYNSIYVNSGSSILEYTTLSSGTSFTWISASDTDYVLLKGSTVKSTIFQYHIFENDELSVSGSVTFMADRQTLDDDSAQTYSLYGYETFQNSVESFIESVFEGYNSVTVNTLSGYIITWGGVAYNKITTNGTTLFPLYTDNFKVDSEGRLYASDANLTGTINADDGTIGSINIDKNGLYSDKIRISKEQIAVLSGETGTIITKEGLVTKVASDTPVFSLYSNKTYKNTSTFKASSTANTGVSDDSLEPITIL